MTLMDRLGNLKQNAQLVLQSDKTDSKVPFQLAYLFLTDLWEFANMFWKQIWMKE